MSESDGGPGRREVAYRLFAAEYDDADRSHSESDEERAPNYVVTPTGARVNRLFVVGVLTEVESVSEDYLRARVVDPTGPFVVYAGQYQPEAMRFLEAAEPPAFVAVTGKARTFQPEDSDRVYTSIRPESINEVDAETRDRWVIQAAHATIERVTRVAEAKATGLAGEDLTATLRAGDVDAGLVTGIPIALSHYGTTGKYLATLRTVATQALEVVAGDRDEIDATLPAPDAGEDEPVAALAERTLEAVSAGPDGESEASGERSVDVSAEEDESGSAVEHSDAAGEAGSTEPTEATESVPGTTEAEVTPETDSSDDESPDGAVATASDAGGETEDVGESEQTESGSPASEEPLGDFDLDESEREEIESEYGTEFKSGTEVEEPGEADIETPDSGDGPAVETEAQPDTATSNEPSEVGADATPEPEPDDEGGVEPDDAEAAESADDHADGVPIDDAVMDAMTDLDEGDGADREAVIASVVDDTGVDPDAVEDAIQEALMDGRCYEPADGTLKPI